LLREKGKRVEYFYRLLKKDEIEEMAEKIGCSKQDIHVHHRNREPKDNRMANLEVLHKDDHAIKHGYLDWETMGRYVN